MQISRLARRELVILSRSPGIWLTGGLFACILALGVWLPALAFDDATPSLASAFLLGPATELLLPVVAIVFGHGAIAGRRETGELIHLVTLPHTRRDILAGICVGRVVLISGIIVMGSLPAVGVLVALYGLPPMGRVVGFLALTTIVAGCYTAIGVGVSAIVRTRIHALGILLGGFAVFHALWAPLVDALTATVENPGSGDTLWWVRFIELLNPLEGYTRLADVILPATPRIHLAVEEGGLSGERGELVGGGLATSDVALPAAVLVAWTAVILLIAVYRVDRMDLH